MVAKIRNLLREPNYQSVCTVECPGCGWLCEIMYGGWTAIVCVGCDTVLYRNRACERSDNTKGGE
jgi:hypothetical protein